MVHSITVIMPNFNGSAFLSEAIQSVTQQTFKDFELIVVDDGSVDRSVEIVERFRDKDDRVRLIEHERNRGVSAARNTGLENANSSLVTFMDSDDLVAKERLSRLANESAQRGTPSVIYSDVIPIGPDAKSVESKPSGLFRPSGMILGALLADSFRFIAGPITAPRSLFREIGPYDEQLTWGEDFELCLRLAKKYPFVFDPVSTYGARTHTGSRTSNITRKERWRQQASILERQLPGSLAGLKAHERRGLYNYLFSSYIASNQTGKILRIGVSDVQAFLSMMAIPARALGRR
jgi:glycosyltransferase involved in cell wall biosynthesis